MWKILFLIAFACVHFYCLEDASSPVPVSENKTESMEREGSLLMIGGELRADDQVRNVSCI